MSVDMEKWERRWRAEIHSGSSVEELLDKAMKDEREAISFYSDAYPQVSEPLEVAQLFRELALEERIHLERLEAAKSLIFPSKRSSSNPNEVKRDPRTDRIVEVYGKTVYSHVFPDWIFSYVEFKTEDEKVGMRRALSREEDVSFLKVTDHRIYFEEREG